MRISFLIIFLLAVTLVPSRILCAETTTAEKTAAEWIKTELYLGKETLAGYEISEQQFAKFLEKVVTKYFPKGFTLYETYGQMQEPDGAITKQATWVVVIVHENTQENEKAVEAVVEEYRKLFQNAEVMRTKSTVEAQFYTQI